MIKGTAPAGHRVQVTVEVQAAGLANPRVIGPLTVTVGSNGTWEIRVQPPADLLAVVQVVTITAVAVAPLGRPLGAGPGCAASAGPRA